MVIRQPDVAVRCSPVHVRGFMPRRRRAQSGGAGSTAADELEHARGHDAPRGVPGETIAEIAKRCAFQPMRAARPASGLLRTRAGCPSTCSTVRSFSATWKLLVAFRAPTACAAPTISTCSSSSDGKLAGTLSPAVMGREAMAVSAAPSALPRTTRSPPNSHVTQSPILYAAHLRVSPSDTASTARRQPPSSCRSPSRTTRR